MAHCDRSIERVYWSAVASLNNESDELVDEAVTHLSDATVACPELLARLADDRITRETYASTDAASARERSQEGNQRLQ